MRQSTYSRASAPGVAAPDQVGVRAVAGLAFVALTVGLVVIAQMGSLMIAGIAIGAAAFVLMVCLTGWELGGTITVGLAFVTAPVYKGIATSPDAPVTPTDLLFVIGFVLLLPTMLRRKLRLPFTFLLGLLVVFVAGALGTLFSYAPIVSAISLVLWVAVMGGFPIFIAWWRPSMQVVTVLACCYVGGHMISTAYGLVSGPSEAGRYGGLASHYNYFAQAALFSFALLLFVLARTRTLLERLMVFGAMAVCIYSIQLSGSRAALVVLAVLVLMIPVVERSALLGFVMASLGALALVLFSLLVNVAGEDSALGRLVGGGGSQYSDQAREMGRDAGLARFSDHPILGSGVVDLFDIHNNYLEVLVAAGIIGLVGYVGILYTLARPIVSELPSRRLCYSVWAYIGFGATIPGLYDRGVWSAVALAIIPAMHWRDLNARTEEEPPTTPSRERTLELL